MIELKKQATPPSKEQFIQVYQLSKLGINLLAKLSHHLTSPSASELLTSIFKYILEFVQINKGYVPNGRVERVTVGREERNKVH